MKTIKTPSQKEILRLVSALKKAGVNATTGDRMPKRKVA